MKTRALSDWLAWIETLHPRKIELGLERVHAVLDRLRLRHPGYRVITVAGTNGKGSAAAMLEACLRAAGHRVGTYTSPHLIKYNERVRVDGVDATDVALCATFERIESARGETPLTYFEFGTLAAFDQFARAGIDVAVLEVGLGGRLDAVNAIDADAALVTSIGIDHVQWLGDTRAAIGREKAGVFRKDRPAICADPAPPASIAEVAQAVGARLYQRSRDFFVERGDSGWTWKYGNTVRAGLPVPALRGDYQLDNAAGALMVFETLRDVLPVSQAHIREGLLAAVVPGRFQVLPGLPLRVLDVAHNPDAVRVLARTLTQQTVTGRTLAVFGMLRDKDMVGAVRSMRDIVDAWYVTALGQQTERGATAEEVAQAIARAGLDKPVMPFNDARAAYAAARRDAGPADRIVVFGSFYMVGDILSLPKKDL
ncbi:MAG: bifunctional tetrahydrofolate synthase/dihydrofolate synthase [Gammaproteobacteria bacterium]|nr:bifunctional tetrahydrofolate synthase/dihydrofolate synthase [Gammaproteobacteria bacterium]